ncbi:hypothetical protein GCM10009416_16780 [Craurococcus roseus]|uniref:Uncharacterized protein n=1 Tax=Craurococcus roseus TaxID=77585 RepID=A0ABN1F077_9PROT
MGFRSAVLAVAMPAAGQHAFDQRCGRNGAGPDPRGMVGHTAGSTPYPGLEDGQRMNDPPAHPHRAAGTAR